MKLKTKSRKKVTEDTATYIRDIRGTLALIHEDIESVEGVLGLDITEGGHPAVGDPEAFEALVNDIANQIFQAHLRLEDVLDKFSRTA
jgi:hypothetical protein